MANNNDDNRINKNVVGRRQGISSALADANDIKEIAPDDFNNDENNEDEKSKLEGKKAFGESVRRGRIFEKIKLAKAMNNNKEKKKDLGNVPKPQNKNNR